VQHKRRTLAVDRTSRHSKKDATVFKAKQLAKQLSELRQLRERVQRAEAARAFR
jgi:hypothetical protein